MWLAVAGKGGSGKSMVAGTLARVLARRGHQVLAIDSDPMPGLSRSLGAEEPAEPPLNQAAEKDGDGRWRLRRGIGPARAVQRYSTPAPDGVRLLQLGKADREGLANVIGSINAFLHVVHRLDEAKTLRDWTVIGDLPAGPRHAAAGFAPYARLYVVLVEPTGQSALTARRVARIARDHRGAEVLFVGNKVGDATARRRTERLLGGKLACVIPFDHEVADVEARGEPLLDAAPRSRATRAIERLADHLEARNL
jgi:CO dehydrogenase maturation factor